MKATFAQLVSYATIAGLTMACNGSSTPSAHTVTVHKSQDTIYLSAAPNAIAAAQSAPDTLEADLQVGGAESPLGFIADVVPDVRRGFWVLDRLNRQVVHFDSSGAIVDRFGREGPGPGEFRQPWALARLGKRLVVWDRSPDRTFTLLEPDGAVVESAITPVEADWFSLQLRGPRYRFEPGFRTAPGGIPERIGGVDSSGFLHQAQPDEIRAVQNGSAFDPSRVPVYLIHYDAGLRPTDTVATMTAPPLRRVDRPGMMPKFEEKHFADRPLWAVGDGWVAVRNRGATAVQIRRVQTDVLISTVSWTAAEQPLTMKDREEYWSWVAGETVDRYGTSKVREAFGDQSKRERDIMVRDAASDEESMRTPSIRPELMALYGGGQCLWLAGFQIEDAPTGIALTLLAIGLETGRVEFHARIPRRGARVRAISRSAIFTSHVDDNGVVRAERYPLPDRRCASGQP